MNAVGLANQPLICVSASRRSARMGSGGAARDATIDLSGSGDAMVAPTGDVQVRIDGSGDVTLAARPAKLTTELSGSGDVVMTGDLTRVRVDRKGASVGFGLSGDTKDHGSRSAREASRGNYV
jgi:hypothetical protein